MLHKKHADPIREVTMVSCCPEEKDHHTTVQCSCQEAPAAGLKSDFPMTSDDTAVCCGGQSPEPHAQHEKPGFRVLGFVEDFLETPAGLIPKVRTHLICADRLGTVSARVGSSETATA